MRMPPRTNNNPQQFLRRWHVGLNSFTQPNGRLKVTFVPFPTPPDSAQMWPPWASTQALAMVRPMPVPLVEWLSLPWKKGSKMDGKSFGEMPVPLSWTETRMFLSSCFMARLISPWRVNLMALERRLETTYSIFLWSQAVERVGGLASTVIRFPLN